MGRKRKALDPIPLEEIAGATGMSGFVSFLNIPPTDRRGGKESTYVDTTKVITSTPEFTLSDTTQAKSTYGDTAYVESTQVGSVPVLAAGRPPKIRPVTVLQDALSTGEQILYNALFLHAKAWQQQAKVITLGAYRMAEISRLSPKNCQLNVRALIEKRVVEPIGPPNFRDGRTYLIYGHEAALERQRGAGLTHVVRNRGVVFVDPQTGRELTRKVHAAAKSTRVQST